LEKYVLTSGVFDNEVQCKVYWEVFEHLPAPKGALKQNERDWLNKNLSKLMRMAELFLSIQDIKESDDHKCDLLYPKLLARKQYQSFNRHIKKDIKAFDKQVNKGATYYVQKYKTEKAILHYLHQSGQLIKKDNLPELIQNLDMYYALEKLDLHITTLSMAHVPGKGMYDLSSMDATASLLDLPQYADNPLITLYQANVTLMKTESEAAYFDLLNLLNQYESLVPLDVLKGFYTAAANHCAGQINRGNLEYNKKMYDLYTIMDDKQLLIDGGAIPAIKFKNVVIMGCRVGEYDWATEFIERYRLYIRQEIRDSVCHFNLGIVSFHQKDFTSAHGEFIQVGKVNRTYDINVKILIIKCLYEGETDYDSMMRSFRTSEKYFRENKSLSAKSKTSYANFIKILSLLYRVRHDVNAIKADVERIKEKLDARKVNSDKRWLLEKIKELQNKIK